MHNHLWLGTITTEELQPRYHNTYYARVVYSTVSLRVPPIGLTQKLGVQGIGVQVQASDIGKPSFSEAIRTVWASATYRANIHAMSIKIRSRTRTPAQEAAGLASKTFHIANAMSWPCGSSLLIVASTTSSV